MEVREEYRKHNRVCWQGGMETTQGFINRKSYTDRGLDQLDRGGLVSPDGTNVRVWACKR